MTTKAVVLQILDGNNPHSGKYHITDDLNSNLHLLTEPDIVNISRNHLVAILDGNMRRDNCSLQRIGEILLRFGIEPKDLCVRSCSDFERLIHGSSGSPLLMHLLISKRFSEEIKSSYRRFCYFNEGDCSWRGTDAVIQQYNTNLLDHLNELYGLLGRNFFFSEDHHCNSTFPLEQYLRQSVSQCLKTVTGLRNVGLIEQAGKYEELLYLFEQWIHPLGFLRDKKTLLVLTP